MPFPGRTTSITPLHSLEAHHMETARGLLKRVFCKPEELSSGDFKVEFQEKYL
jgi:hypothetical protein